MENHETIDSSDMAEPRMRVESLREHITRGDHLATIGERKFDKLTYNYIGYIANALLSVAAVYWVERTHSGQNFMRGFVGWAKSHISLNPKTVEMLATKSFFLTGGFAVLLPMKWLENSKVHWVKKWNRAAYGDRVDTDSALIQSQKEVEDAPRQTWSSIFSGRVLALIPFFATISMLWDRKSPLARLTNPELGAMSKDAARAMEETSAQAFSQIASKGIYFDRPIAAASRLIGKGIAKVSGNGHALERIRTMEKTYPGHIQSKVTDNGHDPVHSALPYYFISEAITSGLVAWGVYHLTRLTGYIIGKPPVISPRLKGEALISADEAPGLPAQGVRVSTEGLEYHQPVSPLIQTHARG